VRWIIGAAVILAGTAPRNLAAQPAAQDHAGQYAQADIVYGAQIYAAQCATCHGANGDGVGGVNLRSGQLRRASTDAELGRLIASGIPSAGMPPFSFTAAEQVGIVAYVRNMNALDVSSVKPGNAARGREIFEGKGACLTCHAVNDRGSPVAPDLSDIGANRAPSALERHLLTPDLQTMPINRPLRLVMRDGKVINGRRLNEDTYTVQLMDTTGQLVSVSKADVRESRIVATSPMPSYKEKLSSEELSDLVAYLLSLKGTERP
jgi:putative heme-binding domain-containing protein